MTIKIDEKIIGQEIVRDSAKQEVAKPYERPAPALPSRTYKIRPATMDAALYITISDIVIEDGSPRPFEIFINSKQRTHEEWIIALTRVVSAWFRSHGQLEFIVDELCQVADSNGGYFLQKNDPCGKGKCPSIVAHIGKIIRVHCLANGSIKTAEMAPERKAALEEKKKEAEARGTTMQECPKCHEKAMVSMDGCLTCVNCGNSRCDG
jgi:hypothetical protein